MMIYCGDADFPFVQVSHASNKKQKKTKHNKCCELKPPKSELNMAAYMLHSI